MNIPSEIHRRFAESRGFRLSPSVMFAARSGSHSYGTQIVDPNAPVQSDNDAVLVVVPPENLVYGVAPWTTPYQLQHEDWDVTVYPLSQFIRLLLKGNPSLACILWSDDRSIDWVSPHFSKILECRDSFSSLHLVRAFTGYAAGQFREMELTQGRPTGKLGEKRKKLVETYGYDTKNAGHLVRLLRMCLEFLIDGKLRVFRTHDADHLRAIRSGNFSMGEVKEEADRLFREISLAIPASSVPEQPDTKFVERLMMDCYKNHWGTFPNYQSDVLV